MMLINFEMSAVGGEETTVNTYAEAEHGYRKSAVYRRQRHLTMNRGRAPEGFLTC